MIADEQTTRRIASYIIFVTTSAAFYIASHQKRVSLLCALLVSLRAFSRLSFGFERSLRRVSSSHSPSLSARLLLVRVLAPKETDAFPHSPPPEARDRERHAFNNARFGVAFLFSVFFSLFFRFTEAFFFVVSFRQRREGVQKKQKRPRRAFGG